MAAVVSSSFAHRDDNFLSQQQQQQTDSLATSPNNDSLIIPIRSKNQEPNFIEIFPDELSTVPLSTLLSVLRDEIAPLTTWTDAALLFLSHPLMRRPADCLSVLTNACTELENKGILDKNEDRVRLFATTGIAYLAQQKIQSRKTDASNTSNKLLPRSSSTASTSINNDTNVINTNNDDRDEEFKSLADAHFNRASKIDQFFPMTWIGQGMYHLHELKFERARFFFETTRKQCGDILPALLGLACIKFKEAKFSESQQLYARAIELYPLDTGNTSNNNDKSFTISITDASAIRVGFALSCYKLGQIDRARAAFVRARDIDTENVEAMVGIAVIDLANHNILDESMVVNSADNFEAKTRVENAIKLISVANLINHSNAMVQNHLANHYFWKWNALSVVAPVSTDAVIPSGRSGGGTVVTVSVQNGSTVVLWESMGHITLDPGDRIRIGFDFETTVLEVEDDEDDEAKSEDHTHSGHVIYQKMFRIKDPWRGPSEQGLQLWKKDFDRVIALAKGAHSSTTIREIQAESLFHLARVYHVRDDMENAHKFYQRACILAPDFAPARYGLAQTLIWDETYDEAAAHLRLVVGTCSSATDAFALLGLLEVKAGKGENKKEAFSYLKKAIDLDPFNPDLVLLEALAFQQHQSDYHVALERYRKAVELMEVQGHDISWEISTNMGVLCHETKQYEEAAAHYEKALRSLDGGMTNVLSLKEEVVAKIRHNDNRMFWEYIDTGVTLATPPEAVTTRWEVMQGTLSTHIAIGDHILIGDKFETEILIIEENKRIIAKDPVDTTTIHASSTIKLFVKRDNNRLSNPSSISVAFNIARLHEAAGRILPAIELHKAILKRHPSYVNSYLRLACIARDSGSLKDCSEWLKSACAIAPGNPEVLTLVGNLHLSLCDWAPAQSVFDQLLQQKIPNVEAYSMLCLGNIYFHNLKTPDRYAKHLQYAADWYKRILNRDKSNAYAANGIGTVLAEKGELFKAKEVFNRVREISGDTIPDVLLNLGHVYLALSKHPEALQMYQSYMNRSRSSGTPITSKSQDEDDAAVLLFIAFAYFDWARQTEAFNNAKAALADERYKTCLEYIDRALKKSKKDNVTLRYNWCMAKLQAANCVLQKPSRNIRRTAKEVQEALQGLEESLIRVQTMLQWKHEGKKIPITTSMLSNFVTQCKANIESAKSHLNQELKREAEARELEMLQLQSTQAQQQVEEARKKVQMEKEKREQEERDNKARMKMEKVSSLLAGWEQDARAREEASTKKKSKSNNGVPVVDDEEVDPAAEALFDESDDESADATNGQANPSVNTTRRSKAHSDSEDSDSFDKGVINETSTRIASASRPSVKDIFGDSSDDNSELISTKRKSDTVAHEWDELPMQSSKKQRFMEESEDSV